MKITGEFLELINKPKLSRQERWKEKGYTSEQIECHLEGERRKSKEARERKKRNNEKNQELIKQIEEDLLGKTFGNSKIIKINPTTDGIGFWFSIFKKFNDGSAGTFRYFSHFDEYEKGEFISNLSYL